MIATTLATATETGESPFAVRIEMGAFQMTGDEPVSEGGGGFGPSPFQLLSAALAECTAMTVRWYARQQRWPVDHVEVSVEHRRERAEGSLKNLEHFEKAVTITGDRLTEEQRARLISIAHKCPVHRALEGGSVITTKTGPASPSADTSASPTG